MYAQSRDRLHAPAPILKQMVDGWVARAEVRTGVLRVRAWPAGRRRRRRVHDCLHHVAARCSRRPTGRGRRLGAAGRWALVDAFAGAYDVRRITEHDAAMWVRDPLPSALEELRTCDLVLDVGDDDLAAAQARFETYDMVAPSAVVATASLTHSVTACAAATGRPEHVVGLHIHPLRAGASPGRDRAGRRHAPTRRSRRCAPSSIGSAACAGLSTIGPAGSSTASLVPFLNDALKMVESGYASADDVDAAMKLGCGYPRGPVEAADALGLDLVLAGAARAPPGERRARPRSGADARAARRRRPPRRRVRPRRPRARQADEHMSRRRQRSARPATDGVGRAGAYETVEVWADGEWAVRRLTGVGLDEALSLPGLRAAHPDRDTPPRRLAGRGHGARRRAGRAPPLAQRMLAGPRPAGAAPMSDRPSPPSVDLAFSTYGDDRSAARDGRRCCTGCSARVATG